MTKATNEDVPPLFILAAVVVLGLIVFLLVRLRRVCCESKSERKSRLELVLFETSFEMDKAAQKATEFEAMMLECPSLMRDVDVLYAYQRQVAHLSDAKTKNEAATKEMQGHF